MHGSAAEVYGRQHYRLIGWKRNVCGYRRFFSITSLAGLRQEDRSVFDATHVEVKRWFTEGLVDGIRIDHPDGLSDPAGYLRWLRELTGPDAWIVIEKILAVDEALDPTLPVAGTTGYDALREIGGLFVDPTGKQALTELVDSAGGDYALTPVVARELKIDAINETLRSELGRLCRAIVAAADDDHPDLAAAVAALLSHIGVYRSDYLSLATVLPVALAETADEAPHFAEPLAIIAVAIATSTEVAARLQQLCGAATAKSMEDCLFYRDARLISLNEVGGEPEWFGVGAAEFHDRRRGPGPPVAVGDDDAVHPRHQARRGRPRPDRRAVAGAVAVGRAGGQVGRGRASPRPGDCTLPAAERVRSVAGRRRRSPRSCATRLHAYAEKAIREAGTHTTWNDPDDGFESAVHDWLDEVFDGPVGTELTSLVARLDAYGHGDALGQKLIQLTVARGARRLPGHRTLGGQPRRPRQPQGRRLRRAPRGAADARTPQDPCHVRAHCGCEVNGRRPSCPADTGRFSPAARHASTWSPTYAATTCWWPSAGGR